jgi:hypothetical protein
MDNEYQLRAQVVSALEAVTPPAPWLASNVRESLTAGPRREGRPVMAAAGFVVRGLTPALAVLLVVLLVATAVGIVAMRTAQHPVPADHAQPDVVRYAALLTKDKQLLDEAADFKVFVGANSELGCLGGPPGQQCPARLSQVEGAYQRFLNDLDHTTPPARFAAEHARMLADLQALIRVLGMAEVGLVVTKDAAQPWDEFLTIEGYVVYEAGRGEPVRDAATAAYVAMVARDYDRMYPSTLLTDLLRCEEAPHGTPACVGSVPTARRAAQAFLADLQGTTPPARFATIHDSLVSSLATELRGLDEVDAAISGSFAPGPSPDASQVAMFQATHDVIDALGGVSTNAAGILYATD